MYDSNLTDTDFQKTLIDSRGDDMIIIPMYVIVCGQKYSILDLDSIPRFVTKTQFKVGFGTSNSVIAKPNNFPTALFYNFNVTPLFSNLNIETNIQTDYFVLEESYFLEKDDNPIVNKLYQEINRWIDRLYDAFKACFFAGNSKDTDDTSEEEEDEPVDRPYYDTYDDPDYFD